MKKYNVVFLFILLLFLGLSKNINISTKDNSSTTSNVASSVSSSDIKEKEPTIPYIPESNISIDSNGTITAINAEGLSGDICIPEVVNGITVKSLGSSTSGSGLFGSTTSNPNTSITRIFIPDTVTSIGYNAFAYLSGIVEMIIPENVTSLSDQFFYSNPNLVKVFILGAVSYWPNRFFFGCSSLQLVYFLNDNMFTSFSTTTDPLYGNNSSTTVYFSSSAVRERVKAKSGTNVVSTWTLSTDYVYKYSTSNKMVYNNSNGKIVKYTSTIYSDVVIPNIIDATAITTIGNESFRENYFCKNVIISEGITTIEDGTGNNGAFSRSRNINTITLPSTLKYIGAGAFNDTYSTFIYDQKEQTIPDSVTYIGDYAFAANNIVNFYLGTGVTTIKNRAFSYNTMLEKIFVNSVITTVESEQFINGSKTPKFVFSSKSNYSSNVNVFKTLYANYLAYKVEIQYLNVGLYTNPSFTTDFESKINDHKDNDSTSSIITYTYYTDDSIQIPTITDFMYHEGQTLALYTDQAYKSSINSGNTSGDGQINAGKLVLGTVNDTLVIYCNLYTDPANESNQEKYTLASFDSNNNPLSNIFTINNLNKELNLRFTNDENTGVTGLPVVGYTYTYTWYVKANNSSTFALISNNNDKEPSTLTLIPLSGADLNATYRCIIIITSTSTSSVITMSKDITLTYEKEDITIVVNDQNASNTGAISSIYGTDYTASINGVVLSEDEMNLYFGSNYGLVSKSNNGNIEISFFGTLQEPYRSNYNVNTLQTGILTTKTNSTNLILISVTSGLFVVEVIVFMVVIFKQRSRG